MNKGLWAVIGCSVIACAYAATDGILSSNPNPPITAPVYMGSPGYTAATNAVAVQATGNVNNYWQFSLQNINPGSSASSDFVVTADDGNDTTHYGDYGINNSGGGSAPFTNAHAVYLYTTDNELDLAALGASGVINLTAANGVKISNFASASATPVCQSGGVLSTCVASVTPVNADWNASSGLAQILNKPSLATVATSGSYADLSNKPVIPVVQAYEGVTQRLNPILINKTATVSDSAGHAVYNLTVDGLSTGAALCPNGVMLNSPNLSVNDATAPYQFSWAWTNSNKTLTVLAEKASGLAVLTFTLLGLPAPVPNGTIVNETVICY